MITKEQQNFKASFTNTGDTFSAKISEGAVDSAVRYQAGYNDGYKKGVASSTGIRLADVNLVASAWEGSEKLWSQNVVIDGSTEFSKVDLTPSAEQLAIFYEKDITFTTENNDGIITVFAIGDKPSDDYTIPAVVTEVSI